MKSLSHLTAPYDFFVDFVAEEVFDHHQRQEYKTINECCGNCFIFAKKDALDEANGYFEESVYLFETCQNKHWISALCMPNISYYEYRTSNYELAIKHTNQIICSLKYLQKNHYPYLFFSEIQQHQNIGRIYFSMDMLSLAMDECVYCLSSIVEHSKIFQSNNMIYGVPERELYNLTRYPMTIQILSETCNKLISRHQNDLAQIQYWLADFIRQILVLDFTSVSADPRYKAIDTFIGLMAELLTNDDGELQENVLLFAKDPYADKTLLKTLFKYINSAVQLPNQLSI